MELSDWSSPLHLITSYRLTHHGTEGMHSAFLGTLRGAHANTEMPRTALEQTHFLLLIHISLYHSPVYSH